MCKEGRGKHKITGQREKHGYRFERLQTGQALRAESEVLVEMDLLVRAQFLQLSQQPTGPFMYRDDQLLNMSFD